MKVFVATELCTFGIGTEKVVELVDAFLTFHMLMLHIGESVAELEEALLAFGTLQEDGPLREIKGVSTLEIDAVYG